MGIFRKIFGIPEQKIVYTKDSLIIVARKVIPSSKLEVFEQKLLDYYRRERIAEYLCNQIAEGLFEHARLSRGEVDRIMDSQIIERFALYYGINSYLAGFVADYAFKYNKNHLVDSELEKIIKLLMAELEEEMSRMYNSVKITEVFKGVSKLAFSIGKEIVNLVD